MDVWDLPSQFVLILYIVRAKDNAHLKVSSQSAETTEHPADTCMMDMLSHQEEAEVVSHGLKENTWEVCMLSPAFLQLTGLRDLAGNYWVMVISLLQYSKASSDRVA
ncbi:hypothetical protein EOD39_10892 [Acipenser ruthenus]|uniref:Uncharacterized protein n=1 Tax=Acipenser ruthenus TaxID=7906 RepID=A0A444TWV1_ACIRT|nr:hypothetical protein EOD39_10892 [Acipenser ruthenus]